MKTNRQLTDLIQELKKHGWKENAGVYRRIASDLEKSVRAKRVVNLSRLNRNSKPNEILVVPGKVLGSGALNHSITVAAFNFSKSAREEIESAKGSCMTLAELMRKFPKGKELRIIG